MPTCSRDGCRARSMPRSRATATPPQTRRRSRPEASARSRALSSRPTARQRPSAAGSTRCRAACPSIRPLRRSVRARHRLTCSARRLLQCARRPLCPSRPAQCLWPASAWTTRQRWPVSARNVGSADCRAAAHSSISQSSGHQAEIASLLSLVLHFVFVPLLLTALALL